MNRIKGSIFYKDDKNISDALKQQTPSKKTLENHLKSRGLLLSPDDSKEDIAEYLAPWFTSFFDQKFIVEEKGGGNTHKKFTNSEVLVDYSDSDIKDILREIKRDSSLEMNFNIKHFENSIVIEESYTKPDFTKNVLSQNIPKTAEIEIKRTAEGKVLIRSNNDEHASKITSIIRSKLQEANPEDYDEFVISFVGVTDSRIRTKFFLDLAQYIDGYKISNMKSVAVGKADPTVLHEDEDVDDETLGYIKRIMLNGGSVHQSKELTNLLDQDFYITRIEWTMESEMLSGDKIDLYAEFKDTNNCSNLVYALQRVYTKKQDGGFVITGKAPSYMDNNNILPKIESSAKRAFNLAQQDFNNEGLAESDDEDD